MTKYRKTKLKSYLPDNVFYYFFHLNERGLEGFEAQWNKLGAYVVNNSKSLSNILHKTAKHLTDFKRERQNYERANNCIQHVQQNITFWQDQAISKMETGEFKAQELSNSLWAYATLGVVPSKEFMKVFENQAISRMGAGKFEAQNLSNTLWAYATLRIEPSKEFMKVFENQAISRMGAGKFEAQNLSNTLWAYATLGIEPSKEFMKEFEEQAISKMKVREFYTQELSNSLWAYATLGIEPSKEFMKEFEEQAISKMEAGQFNTQGLCNSLWAMGAIDSFSNYDLFPLYQRFRSEIPSNLRSEEQKQIRDSDLWFTGHSNLKNIDWKETTKSHTEGKLKEAFGKVNGFIVHAERGVIDQFKQAVDFVVEENGQPVLFEMDGPTHYVRNWKTGEVRLNGATMYRTALMQKFAPDAKIARMGIQRAHELMDNQTALSKIYQYVTSQSPGAHLIPEPNQSDDNIICFKAKRPLDSHARKVA